MFSARAEADYLLETAIDPGKAAEIIAGGQSSGAFVAVPGETPELKARAAARVIRLEVLDEGVPAPSLPSAGLKLPAQGGLRRAMLTLSWPLGNLGPSLRGRARSRSRVGRSASRISSALPEWGARRELSTKGGNGGMRLTNKVAIVTGGARGIGFAVAVALAREGAAVAVADINAEGAKAAAEKLTREGARALNIAVNVADAASVEAMVRAVIDACGRLDILVNNAGVGGNTPFLETSLADWNRIIGINLTGAFLVAQAVAREMVKGGHGGKIVNIASLSGQRGGRGRAAYGSAKAGLELLTKVMAVELAEHDINVNNIAPGAIETEMAKFVHDAETRAAYDYLIPMTRYGTPDEIADAAVFLCSDESRYVHGHTLNVDGGFRAAGLMFGPRKRAPRP